VGRALGMVERGGNTLATTIMSLHNIL